MLREMSSSQYNEWIAFYKHWNPGEEDDHRFGVIASAIYNTAMSGSKNRKAYQPTDFFPPRNPKPKLSADELLKKVVAANTNMGGTDKRTQR